jgi:hypothetical protein
MVVKSYWRGVQLEKKSHPCVPFAESPREEFLPFPARRGARETFPAKAASWVIGQAMLSKV